jgi:hypothetical protein
MHEGGHHNGGGAHALAAVGSGCSTGVCTKLGTAPAGRACVHTFAAAGTGWEAVAFAGWEVAVCAGWEVAACAGWEAAAACMKTGTTAGTSWEAGVYAKGAPWWAAARKAGL